MKSYRTDCLQIITFSSIFLQTLFVLFGGVSLLVLNTIPSSAQSQSVLHVTKTEDFTITGTGTADNWSQTKWFNLTQRTNHKNDTGRKTSVKVLYSDFGIYFLFLCEDDIVSSTISSNFEEIWREDVVEIFLWPDESEEVYFEYELSPLNYELPLLVSKTESGQSHWIPFEYSYKNGDSRKSIHNTSATRGNLESGERITEWRAEFYIPFELLIPLKNRTPTSGTTWRTNMYRVDYDHGLTSWSWQSVDTDFHDIYNYGIFIFE